MSNFLIEYGLFVAKALTIILSIIITVIFIIGIVYSKKKHKEENYIEIENINDKLEELQDNLESEILDKTTYKKLQKNKKKQKKSEEKSKKQSCKITEEGIETHRPRIFVLTFNGDLHASETTNLREEISAILTVAQKNDEVLVKLESSGGVVHNYGFAAAQLERIKQHHVNLIISVNLVAASGGYMMACVANKIIAAPFAILGSIGVMAELPNFNKLLEKHHVDIEHHTSGEYKTTLTMLGKNTDKGRQKFIEELEDTHKLFKEFVKLHRPSINLEKIATGEYWYGIESLELNLIDEIQISDDYLMNKSKDYDIYTIEYKIQESLKDKLTNALANLANASNFILAKFNRKKIIN